MTLEWHFGSAIAILILLGISGFASSSETSFFSLNRFQLRRIRDQNKNAFRRIKELLAKPSKLLTLILLINETVNIIISSLVTSFVSANSKFLTLFWNAESITEYKLWLITAMISMSISVTLILIIGDMTPKVVASRMNRFLAVLNSKVLYILYKVLNPFLVVIDMLINYGLRFLGIEGKDHFSKTMSALSEEEFLILMEEGHREGTVNRDERELITNVLEFDDTHVSNVMTPLPRVFALAEDLPLAEALKEIKAQKYSRVPIYRGNPSKITGLIFVRQLLDLSDKPEKLKLPIKNFAKPIMSVGPGTTLNVLFRKMKTEKNHFTVIHNNKNDVIGIATIENVLESIFGAIEDERDVR